MMAPVLIAVDWGTSSFRTYLSGADGSVLGSHEAPDGILSAAREGFESVLARHIGGWLRGSSGTLPVLMSGMIGSRQGWFEAHYVHTPARVADLAAGLRARQTSHCGLVHVVPGVDHRHADGTPDVMRGEETQLAGVLHATGWSQAAVVLPGTHSKWVHISDGAVAGFATYMTGEIYAALRDHTILGRLMAAVPDEAAPTADESFRRGVAAGSTGGLPGDLLRLAFSVRTLGLYDMVPATGLADYLSGLLIGAELAVGSRRQPGPLALVGADALIGRYAAAARQLGIALRPIPAISPAAGHLAIARTAGLIGAAP